MPAPSLQLDFLELRTHVGRYLGYGTSTEMDATQLADVDRAIKSGIRSFYFPILVPGERAHQWTFFRPVSSVATVAAQEVYDLPSDFAGILGDMAIDTGTVKRLVKIVGQGEILRASTANTTGSYPVMASVRPKTFDGTGSQAFELRLFPIPSSVFTIHYQYYVSPRGINTDFPYPYGGAGHSETIVEACLAAAESMFNDSEDIHARRFRELLHSSVLSDQRIGTPEYFGYNADPAVGRDGIYFHRVNVVTVNGITPGA